MSQLIDSMIHDHSRNWPRQEVNHGWYLAKPYRNRGLVRRLADALRVITGRSMAVHYAVDDEYVTAKEPR